MFGLGIALKEIFLAYSIQLVFSTIRLGPRNVIMVALYMSRKKPITGEWTYKITWKHVQFNIFVLFIFVLYNSVLKLVFRTVYYFCLDGYFGSCLVAIIGTVAVFIYSIFFFFILYLFIYVFVCFFIYLLFFLLLRLLFLFLLLLSSLLLLLLLESSLPFICVGLLLLLI